MQEPLRPSWGARALVALGIAVCVAIIGHAQSQEEKMNLMELKLGEMENVLRGLTTRNFKSIRTSAAKLQRISLVDEWKKYDVAEYGRQTETFRAAVENLYRMAEERNLEGATLHFNQVTVRCVDCHNLIRDSK